MRKRGFAVPTGSGVTTAHKQTAIQQICTVPGRKPKTALQPSIVARRPNINCARCCCVGAGDVLSLGDGRMPDGSVRSFFLKEGQTVSDQGCGGTRLLVGGVYAAEALAG